MRVADPEDDLAQPTRRDEQDDDDAEPGRRRRRRAGSVRLAPMISAKPTYAAPRSGPAIEPSAADDDHQEHLDALVESKFEVFTPYCEIGEETAGEGGDEPGHGERAEPGPQQVDAERLRGGLVLRGTR